MQNRYTFLITGIMMTVLTSAIALFSPYLLADSSSPTPIIKGIYPSSVYPSDKNTYSVDVLGEGFDTSLPLRIWSEEVGEFNLKVVSTDSSGKNCADFTEATLQIIDATHLRLCNLSQETYKGIQTIWVMPSGKIEGKKTGEAGGSITKTFSAMSKSSSKWIAGIVFIVIFGFIGVILLRSDNEHPNSFNKNDISKTLLLDPETNTLSLAKFQFLVWFSVAIISYVYLIASYTFTQGKIDFVDFPQSLAWIMGISLGTTIGGTAISSYNPKGAGNLNTAFSDLFTTGGIVVLDRLQLFIWTILGAFAYLLIVISTDPAGIANLPDVPNGFLQLMGISSIGYMGGKATRKPGPVIEEIQSKRDSATNTLELMLIGRNLSESATFFLGNTQLKADDIVEAETGRMYEKDTLSQDITMARKLRITLKKVKPEWLKGDKTNPKPQLKLINPDSQSVSYEYGNWPIIMDFNPREIKVNADEVTLTGANFDSKITAAIFAANPAVNLLVTWIDEKTIKIKLNHTVAEKITVEVTNPDKQTDAFAIEVK